jgi:myo-inositol-1(or 4)-monophosphatase
MHALPADLELACAAARSAGRLVLGYFGTALHVRHKAPDQPVTRADLEADARLRAELGDARPDYGWLSEETRDGPDRLARRRVWIVDSIDGTRSFVAGRPEFGVSIGLVEDGAPLLGVVFNPARDELYYAARGAGAYRTVGGGEPVPLQVSRDDAASAAVLLAARSEIAAGELAPFADAWSVQPLGSTAYKLAVVGAGGAHAFVSRGPKSEWDICAGTIIVSEAGGVVTDVHGAVPRFNRPDPRVAGVVAAGPGLHRALLARLATLPPVPRMRTGTGTGTG